MDWLIQVAQTGLYTTLGVAQQIECYFCDHWVAVPIVGVSLSLWAYEHVRRW